ncbi:MAG: tyrosine-type recombinase/integrase [Ruminococcus bromii]|nr:tyrosine-type recombinase/integrase [Ruminococcus bromii]MCI7211702.1 tyrosine-type recombinase/integrase [Ruminococcus bromii]MDD6433081.1 tyrosine-type recombinase/integrase [Ruminococcus bromii]MDY4711402.1 tyrosine-type recombinase/integrase [Ruminococcus bromii]
MAADFRNEAPQILKEYLFYQETVRARSSKTVNEYFIDLRTFFRYLKIHRGLVPSDVEFDKIKIDDVDLDILKTVTLNDAYEYMNYLVRDRNNKVAARARKCSSLKGYFKFLSSNRKYLDKNPLEDLEMPKKPKKLPKYLTLEQSMELLNSVEGDYKERDYAILTLFLNCGLRVSEMAGLNYTDIRTDNTIRVVGKGNKERVIYLNKACLNALNDYMKVRPVDGVKDKKALFISRNHNRMSVKTIQAMVYKYLAKIGLDAQGYSCHKLRHTAATLMYQYGDVDVRVLKEVLGHENLGTTEIYTHLSSTQLKSAADNNPLANVSKNDSDD